MKIRVTQENLHHALNNVSRVAAARASLPILANILIHTEDNQLYLTATNLEMAVRVRVGGKVEQPGKLAIPARLLNEFVSSLPKETIELSATNKYSLKVSAPNYTSTINGTDPEEFPSIPEQTKGETVKIKARALKQALQQVVFAASSDEARQVLTGVYVETNGKRLNFVATDSYRLAEKGVATKSSEIKHNIPANTLQEVLRVLPDTQEEVEMILSESQAVFVIDKTLIISRLIDGNYPDYKQILPKTEEVSAVVDKEEFISITKVASLFARESAGSINVRVSEDSKTIEVESVASQVGENSSSAPAQTKGSGEVALNSKYLIDALQAIPTKQVQFALSGKHSPCTLTPVEEKPNYLHLIMPLKS